jgi:hypothetical protein
MLKDGLLLNEVIQELHHIGMQEAREKAEAEAEKAKEAKREWIEKSHALLTLTGQLPLAEAGLLWYAAEAVERFVQGNTNSFHAPVHEDDIPF